MRELSAVEVQGVSGGVSAGAIEAIDMGLVAVSALGGAMALPLTPIPIVLGAVTVAYFTGYAIGTYAVSAWGAGSTRTPITSIDLQ